MRNNLLTLVNIYLFGHHFLLILKPYVPINIFLSSLFTPLFFSFFLDFFLEL